MKKSIVKTTKKSITKKESEFEMLARIVSGGFDRVEKRFNELETDIEKRFKKVDERFIDLESKMNHKFEIVDSQLSSIRGEQKETNKRLDVIEKKQSGVLASVDEAIHRSEFKALAYKVDMLEKRVSKK